MPQTNYSFFPIPGLPGQVYDLSALQAGDIVSAVAATTIPFGVLCELTANGMLRPVADTNANWPPSGLTGNASIFGVSTFDTEGVEQDYKRSTGIPPTTVGSQSPGYRTGDVVPVLRRGRIWMAYDGLGGTPPVVGRPNVWHSSDGTHSQGVITMTATATTAGAEVSQVPQTMEAFNVGAGLPGNAAIAGQYTDGFGNTFGMIVMSINMPGAM